MTGFFYKNIKITIAKEIDNMEEYSGKCIIEVFVTFTSGWLEIFVTLIILYGKTHALFIFLK